VDECALRKRVQDLNVACDHEECVFFAHFGPDGAPMQCAIQYFKLLDEQGDELAEWLLSLKEDQIVQALGLKKIEPTK
jgi:hypothetical protein